VPVADLCWCQIGLADGSDALSRGTHANVLLTAYVALDVQDPKDNCRT